MTIPWITILSFSFQIAGALILLSWTISNLDKKVVLEHLAQHDGLILKKEDNEMKVELKKDKLQAVTVVRYKNFFAAVNISIGYTCAIFAQNTDYSKSCTFLMVVMLTALIILAEFSLAKHIAKKMYPNDLLLSDSEIKIPEGTVGYEIVE